MITINLLPVSQRRAERKMALPTNFPYKVYLLGAAVLLIFLHIFLGSLMLLKKIQLMSLRRTWTQMEPQSKETTAVRKEIKDMEERSRLISETLSRKASVTELLSSLNAAVPRGLWLESFTFAPEGLVIQGSVVSLEQNEMTLIGKFLQDLRGNKVFVSLFSKVELNSVQRRTIKTYDVVDFVLIGDLKK